MALLVDRKQIVRNALNGDGTAAFSVIPPNNDFWYNPAIARPGEGLGRAERIRRAKALLEDAGYSWSGGDLPHVLPQQEPGPGQDAGGPWAPQHRSAGFCGGLLDAFITACAESSFLTFLLPHCPQAIRCVSLLPIRISVLRPQSRHSNS